MRHRLGYWFDTTMARGTPALITWLAALSLAMVAAVTGAMYLLEPETRRNPFATAWDNLDRMFKLGVPDNGHIVTLCLLLVLALGGIFVVSALVGLLTSSLHRRFAELRKGRSTVIENGHTVVLGWTDQIFTVVTELTLAAEHDRRPTIAILAPNDKVEMEDAIRARLGKIRARVVCRTGSPMDADDLSIVSPSTAKSVIVLSSSHHEDADSFTVKTLLALTRAAGPRWRGVATVRDGENRNVAELACEGRAVILDEDDIVARLIVQTTLQPGLSVVYSELLQFAENEPCFVSTRGVVGASFGQILDVYANACVIGLLRADGRVVLNPPHTTAVLPDDQVVVIAQDSVSIRLAVSPVPVFDQAVLRTPRGLPPLKRVLVLGWNRRGLALLRNLDAYLSPGSEVLVVTDRESAAVEVGEAATDFRVIAPNVKTADTNRHRHLESFGVEGYDHIILLSDDRLDASRADARVFKSLLHLRGLTRGQQQYSIVTEMRDDRDRALADVAKVDDFIVSEKLVSLLMTQIADKPDTSAVFGALFDVEGGEIYLRPAADYVRPGQVVNFATVIEAARRRGECAIGYRVVRNPVNCGVVLNPGRGSMVALAPGDQVIVLH